MAMTLIDALEYIKNSSFNPYPVKGMLIEVVNAKEEVLQALNIFCGEKAQWKKEYEKIIEWLTNSQRQGLLVMGHTGTGKSLFCTKIIPLILAKVFDYRPALCSAYNLNRISERLITNRPDILVLDDIGVESERVDYGERSIAFNEIVDQAERLGQILILTTNLSEDELSKKYGARTMDRLKAITRKVVFQGDSLRVNNNKIKPKAK